MAAKDSLQPSEGLLGFGGHRAARVGRVLPEETVEGGRQGGVVLDVAPEEVAEPQERPDGLDVFRHGPVVGVAQLSRIHFD